MNRKILVGLVILIIAGAGYYLFFGSSSTKLFKGSLTDMSSEFGVPGLPDFLISSLKVEEIKSPKYSTKAIIGFNHSIPNNLQGLKMKISAYVNGNLFATFSKINTSLGTITYNIPPTKLCPTATGTSSVFVILDNENQIAESNENNNVKSYISWCGNLGYGTQFDGYPPAWMIPGVKIPQ